MRLGTETANLQNHLYSRMTRGAPEPVVGMGATILYWSDRKAATVTAWDGKVIEVQYDDAKRVDSNGMSEAQEYEFTPNHGGAVLAFRRTKDGSWKQVQWNPETKRWNQNGSAGLIVGKRDHYHDFSF